MVEHNEGDKTSLETLPAHMTMIQMMDSTHFQAITILFEAE